VGQPPAPSVARAVSEQRRDRRCCGGSTAFLLAALLLNGATLWLTSFEALAAAVTLVMVFALQHTQMRQQAAVQRKLDEILRVLPGADQRLLHLETAPRAELDALDERHGTVRDEALVDPATAK